MAGRPELSNFKYGGVMLDFTYTKEDFSTSKPYEEVLSIKDPFQRETAKSKLAEYARTALKIKNFNTLWKSYLQSQKKQKSNNLTAFTGQKMDLDSGDWIANDYGISRPGTYGEEVACPHPIMPVERLVNIDTNIVKMKLAYCNGDKRWKSIIIDKSVLASRQKVIQLAEQGVEVTSENSSSFVKYMSDVCTLNYNEIPEKRSVSRLGYIQNEGFSPFVDNLVFDGDRDFKHAFDSIHSHGKYEDWLNTVRNIRKTNVVVRIELAASFASVLVQPCGCLPFFVHLWGGTGTGKTVALMLAASVWGNPDLHNGGYIQTFNSTAVGQERFAAFFNNLPFCIDELQLKKDAHGKMNFDVYQLAEGIGRSRGNRNGGVDQTPTWSNCIITTGESPITNGNAGAGAINRVIEVDCSSTQKIIENGLDTAAALRKSYGFAGRDFVSHLYADSGEEIKRAQSLYSDFFKQLSDNDTTEKQAMAAAAILTADYLSTEWIFKDGRALTVKEISQFLASKAAVSSGERGYHYICDWIARNANKMRSHSDESFNDVYGLIQNDTAYIIPSVFQLAAEDGGFSPQVLLSWLREKKLLKLPKDTKSKRNTVTKRINGIVIRCIAIKLEGPDTKMEDYGSELSESDLPFD
jgi:hypothetical protein